MIDPEIQKKLLKATLDPEKVLELAIIIELGARRQLVIQAKHTTDPSMVSIIGQSEHVLAISTSRYRGKFRGNYSQPRGTYTQLRGNSNQSISSTQNQGLHNTRGHTEMQGGKQTNSHTLETIQCERRVNFSGHSTNNPQRNERFSNQCTTRHAPRIVGDDRVSTQIMMAVHKRRCN